MKLALLSIAVLVVVIGYVREFRNVAKGVGDMPPNETLSDLGDKTVGRFSIFAFGFVIALLFGGNLS